MSTPGPHVALIIELVVAAGAFSVAVIGFWIHRPGAVVFASVSLCLLLFAEQRRRLWGADS